MIGAGVSHDSEDRKGKPLPVGDELRSKLVELKKLKPNSSLARVYGALTQGEVDTYVTDPFSSCKAGPTLIKVRNFYWRRVYSLNIDDAMEESYLSPDAKQKSDPLTHKSSFANFTDVDSLQIVHIHGWSGRPEDGYVFSLAEYASSMGPGSAWMHVLSQTVATEPFIIAGTNLEEPDLEYFLAGRQSEGVRRDRGPSFLIEPNPDAATLRECERHGLILYEGTFLKFLEELENAFPSRPLPLAASFDFVKALFVVPPQQRDLATFLRDFVYAVPRQGQEDVDLSFFMGRKPTQNDIALGRDISRSSTLPLKVKIKTILDGPFVSPNFLIVDDNAGSGKNDYIRKIGFRSFGRGISYI